MSVPHNPDILESMTKWKVWVCHVVTTNTTNTGFPFGHCFQNFWMKWHIQDLCLIFFLNEDFYVKNNWTNYTKISSQIHRKNKNQFVKNDFQGEHPQPVDVVGPIILQAKVLILGEDQTKILNVPLDPEILESMTKGKVWVCHVVVTTIQVVDLVQIKVKSSSSSINTIAIIWTVLILIDKVQPVPNLEDINPPHPQGILLSAHCKYTILYIKILEYISL